VLWVSLPMLHAIPKRSVFATTLARHGAFFDAIPACECGGWRHICLLHANAFDARPEAHSKFPPLSNRHPRRDAG
jgi:hypothetical protein